MLVSALVCTAVLWTFSRWLFRDYDLFAWASEASPAAPVSRRLGCLFIITCLPFLLLMYTGSTFARSSEDQVKADMLYYFSLFIDWPDRSLADKSTPFVFCLLGADQLGSWLKDHLRVGIHPAEIRKLDSAEQASECHILFIGSLEQSRLPLIFAHLRNTDVLSVSDIPDFCSQGGMIGLHKEGDQIRFDLNSTLAEKAGLKIDSALKRIARTAECGKGK
jgi:hypothetical protein